MAYNLGIPVYKIEQEMPYTELLKWITYFRRRPVGYREDNRTYMLLRAQGIKESAENLFPTIRAVRNYEDSKIEAGKVMPQGKFLEKMLRAKNGDGSGWDLLTGGQNGKADNQP